MNAIARFAVVALLGCAPAYAAETLESCVHDPAARGMPERIEGLRYQMDRIEWTADRAEQRKLMDLHLKKMHEGMRTMRQRGAGDGCRMEFMQAMLEQMMRHELALR